jgi:diguanylate cyclase (GGDEF)-like protein/PAS domain S-box-containing protein
MTGYSKEELLGKNPRLLKSGEQPDGYYADLWSTVSSGKVWQGEIINKRKDGTTYTEEMTITPVAPDFRDATDTYFIAIKQDITERKQAQEKMTDTLRFTQAILDTSPLGIITYKASGEVVAANPASARLVGASTEQVAALNFRHLESWRRSGLLALAEKALASGGPCHAQVHVTTTFGKEIWVETRFVPFTYADEPHLLTFFEDITQRHCVEEEKQKLVQVVQNSPDLIGIATTDGKVLFVNKAGQALVGIDSNQEATSKVMSEYTPPNEIARFGHEVLPVVLSGKPWWGEASLKHFRTGELIPVEMRAFPICDTDGKVVAIANVSRDIRGRKQSEEALRQAEEKYRGIFEGAAVGIFQSDLSGRYLSANPAMARMLGYDSPQELLTSVTDISRQVYVDSESREAFGLLIEQQGVVKNFELPVYRKDGSRIWISVAARAMRKDGVLIGYEGTTVDITDRKAAEERVQYLAYYDALTGLPNRTLLQDRLTKALASARRQKGKVALLFLDLDRFKTINDSLGHSVGDLFLQEVAERLKRFAREQDTVARVGGDEFLIVLTAVKDAADAAVAAERLMNAITAACAIQGRSLSISCSIGISIFPDHGTDGEALIKNADAAMYCAKESGRNSFHFFTAGMNAEAMERLTLEHSLRLALEKRELFLVYQPQMDIVAGKITGLEALLRWQHPELGLVPPDKFIRIAENSGLIMPIGEWVLRTACSQARKWQDEGLPEVPVAVNVSAVQFRQEHFRELIARVLYETGLAPQYLELELTESLLLSNADVTLSVLEELRAMGLKLAIDDFGTGYSSLSYLRQFPVSKLKIDRSFIRDVAVNPDDAAITTAIISMAKSLQLKVIAEGVENEAQMSFLRAHHCDEIQGYYFSKPLAVDKVADKLRGDYPEAHVRAQASGGQS